MKRRTHDFVIVGYILLGLAVGLAVWLGSFWLMPPELKDSELLAGPLVFFLMLFFFIGLVFVVGGTTNEGIPLKRTFESLKRRFKKNHTDERVRVS